MRLKQCNRVLIFRCGNLIDKCRHIPYNLVIDGIPISYQQRQVARLNIQKKRDFLTSFAYWAIIIAAVYLALKYLLPVSVPFIFGILVAWLVIWISKRLHWSHKLLRIGLALIIYGIIGLLVTLIVSKGISSVSNLIKWLPGIYENHLLPFIMQIYEWCVQFLARLDPAVSSTLNVLLDSIVSALKNLFSSLSSGAVSLVSNIATGVPNLVLSLLTMIFSTVFVVGDYEQITAFTYEHIPVWIRKFFVTIRVYLTDTLFVVIRSYALIMLLTFTELSILFSVFGINNAFLKAALIAVFDVMPILGTGGIMIPWFIISFVLGKTALGLKLLVIYAIVTVVRNYVEPKIVGAQLGLHPIITLVSMFVGLRLFGFWGLFGLPVGISFLWKQKNHRIHTSK